VNYLPIFLDLKNRPCLVVGGGVVGQRKVEKLLAVQAAVRLVSRELVPALEELRASGRVVYLGPEFEEGHLDGVHLVFVCTSDPGLNRRISLEARKRGVEVNVADQPELCTFIVPAVVERGDLVLAVSTSGASPALSARLRARLEKEFGPEYAVFLQLMRRIRERARAGGGASEGNRELYYRLVDSDLLTALAAGDRGRADAILTRILGPGYTLDRLGLEEGP
jgi:precorrin-2 dehydrogenase/sirohydrochlorin ferrochelatase